jgi:hypothetical protein
VYSFGDKTRKQTDINFIHVVQRTFTIYKQRRRLNGNNNNNNNNDDDVGIEIQRIWNVKCFVLLVIIGATGILSKTLQKCLETIPGQRSMDSLQKTAILGTSHIIRKVLQELKPEWWGSPLAQEEKCQGRNKTCNKRI